MNNNNTRKIRVLFVCMGNICRSPAAHGTFQHLVKSKKLDYLFDVDSAGTHAYHVGEPPNSNARKAAKNFGIDLVHSARQFDRKDFAKFDYILPMDQNNLNNVLEHAKTPEERSRVIKFRTFDPVDNGDIPPDVPDPYYGGMDGFDHVQHIMNRTTENLLEWLLQQRK